VRRALVALLACLVLAACTGGDERSAGGGSSVRPTSAAGPKTSSETLARRVCLQTSHEVLLRTWRGVMLGRSGDIQIVPYEWAFVHGGLTHATPFDYTQDVPVVIVGPGYVRPGVYDRPITLADVAPTQAALLKSSFPTPDGQAQAQALLPTAERPLPRLLITLVWDSGGWDVLDRWPNAWPYLRSLAEDAALFTDVTVGASPTNTPVAHATIGTGTFPMRHGFVDEYIRLNEKLQKPNANGPAFLVDPTLADVYDRAHGNRPIVGAIATLAAHVMMMSHGSQWGGGDRDIAVTREKEFAPTAGAESEQWNLTAAMAPFYDLPAYVNDLPPVTAYVRKLDQSDGALDGKWRTNDIDQLAHGFDTPARTPYQTALIREVVAREGFGDDDVPDLLYLNYKAIDTIGHLFSADSFEMADAVAWQDDALRELVAFLDDEVGAGRWVMTILADHGTQRDPEVSGTFLIDIDRLEDQVATAFDADRDRVPLVEKVRPTEIWLDTDELRDNGFTLVEVSDFLMHLTQADTVRANQEPQPGRADTEVFSAALPSTLLSRLPCLPEASAER
jgi:predicted AlkP superfamily pyrophosphatase or phosphodiesterase